MSSSSSKNKCYIVNYNTNRKIILIISIIIPKMIVQVSLLFVSLRIGPIELVQSRHLLFEVPVPSQESAQSYMEEQVQGGGPPPLKLEKIEFFGVKSWFFTQNTPQIFAPPSTRRNFFKRPPPTWNPGSAPVC